MAEHDHYMTLEDGTEILVDFTVESYGSAASGMYGDPEHYDPGEGPELCVTKVTVDDGSPDGVPMELTDALKEKLEDEIRQNPDWFAPSEPDEGWYRDDL